MQVLKFGGSSVANATNMNKVIAIVRKAIASDRTVVVSSAISGATDALLLIGKTAMYADTTTKIQVMKKDGSVRTAKHNMTEISTPPKT